MHRSLLKIGMYIGIGGVSTFKNAKRVREVIAAVPLERILLETDAPYLAPEPYRSKTNHWIKSNVTNSYTFSNINVNINMSIIFNIYVY